MGEIVVGWLERADAFLFGRRTYDIFAAHWPRVTEESDPIAAKLNNLPKYVVSRTLAHAEWNQTRVIGDVAEVAKLMDQPGRELQVHGSARLAQALVDHGLVEEYRLLIYPVVLGHGRRLFVEGSAPTAMQLVETRTTSAGVIACTYHPAGEPRYGSFELDQPEDRFWDPAVRATS